MARRAEAAERLEGYLERLGAAIGWRRNGMLDGDGGAGGGSPSLKNAPLTTKCGKSDEHNRTII